MTRSRRAVRVAGLVGLIGGLAAVQFFLRVPESTPLWEAVFDSGHGPLYGVISLVVLLILDTLWPSLDRPRRYLQAFGITALAGIAMEAAQFVGPRDADLNDILRNLAGSAAFLAFRASFDRGLLYDTMPGLRMRRVGLWIGALLALCFAFTPVGLAAGAIATRNRSFPTLCGFDSVWERPHVVVNRHAEIEFGQAPPAWRRDRDDSVGFVTFWPGRYSMLTLYDPYPDWTGYEQLSFTVFSELDEAVRLKLWIVDDAHVAGDWGFFSRRLVIEPGENLFEVPVSEIRTTARNREIDMTTINKVSIYASRIERPFSLFLDDFRLE